MTDYKYRFREMTPCQIEEMLYSIVKESLYEKYGEKPDELIAIRVEEEWHAMERCKVIFDVAALYELTTWLKENHYPYWMRALSGSSFILYLLGVTNGNPLPPHYYCPRCKSVMWAFSDADGFDLPQGRNCVDDMTTLLSDGHDIPWQILFGFGDFCPVFDIDLPYELYDMLQDTFSTHWIQDIQLDIAPVDPRYRDCKCIKLLHVNLVFCLNRNEISPMFDERQFTSDDRDFILSKCGIFLNEEDDDRTDYPDPNSVADLIALFGISHSIGAWDEVTGLMIGKMGYSFSDMIAFRDDVYRYLIDHNFIEKDAWRGMNRVRKGMELPVVTDEMRQARDKWVLSRCNRIEYLLPKAHAVEYMFFALKSLTN